MQMSGEVAEGAANLARRARKHGRTFMLLQARAARSRQPAQESNHAGIYLGDGWLIQLVGLSGVALREGRRLVRASSFAWGRRPI